MLTLLSKKKKKYSIHKLCVHCVGKWYIKSNILTDLQLSYSPFTSPIPNLFFSSLFYLCFVLVKMVSMLLFSIIYSLLTPVVSVNFFALIFFYWNDLVSILADLIRALRHGDLPNTGVNDKLNCGCVGLRCDVVYTGLLVRLNETSLPLISISCDYRASLWLKSLPISTYLKGEFSLKSEILMFHFPVVLFIHSIVLVLAWLA